MSKKDYVATLQEYLDVREPTIEQAREVFAPLTLGEYEDVHIAALVTAIRTRGETVADIAGAAKEFLKAARPFPVGGKGVIDSAGTGGDGKNTINISTGAALVAAAGGCVMVKHGNRSVSSKSGSADVLEELNIPLDLDVERAERQVTNSGFTFLYAPAYHPAIAHVMPVRKALRVPTIFNILGPLLNPAKPSLQLMGIANERNGQALIEVLRELGRERAMVVHGAGTDEVAVHGTTRVWELKDQEITSYEITPTDLGVDEHKLADLEGGNGAENAVYLRKVFGGESSTAHLDAIAVNAGALFYLDSKADTIKEGTEMAKELIKKGAVKDWLETHEAANYGQ